jgi:hypothetical protein
MSKFFNSLVFISRCFWRFVWMGLLITLLNALMTYFLFINPHDIIFAVAFGGELATMETLIYGPMSFFFFPIYMKKGDE